MNRNKNRSVSYYRVIPRLVRVGVPQTVTVSPMGDGKKFDDALDYIVTFVPRECFSESWIGGVAPAFDTITVRPINGVISVTYTFDEEQEYVISLKPLTDQKISAKKLSLEFCVYALNNDLYELDPYRGDLHSHSTGSDGREDPVIVAANYRKEGYDFFALTDHRNWDSSNELVEKFSTLPLGFKIFRGEEVHIPDNWIHIVNFGGRYSVNTLYRSDPERYDTEIAERAKSLAVPKGVNALEYAYRQWITEEIRRSGGISIVAHPYWIYHQSYNMCDRMLDYVLETGVYDAFELVGGQSVHENNVQNAFYQEQRAKGRQIPIVGSSDSHGTDPASYFGVGQTIVFAKNTDMDSIVDAIKGGYSVAIEKAYGEEERVYGSYRMVKYARFLLDYYFPAHDELCVEEGILMREYALGDEEAADGIVAAANRVKRHMKKALRGEV